MKKRKKKNKFELRMPRLLCLEPPSRGWPLRLWGTRVGNTGSPDLLETLPPGYSRETETARWTWTRGRYGEMQHIDSTIGESGLHLRRCYPSKSYVSSTAHQRFAPPPPHYVAVAWRLSCFMGDAIIAHYFAEAGGGRRIARIAM